MPQPVPHILSRIVLAVAAFVVLAAAIMSQPPKWLMDFDQPFYLTIAYDLDRHGVFSNGIFDDTDSTRAVPPPGMFFVPGYPLLVLAAMKVDSRFAKAVECGIEVDYNRRRRAECEVYATPIYVIHAFLLALAVLAIALAGELIFGSTRVFWIAGALATASLANEADIFSFIMTESLTVSLYSMLMLCAVLSWKTSRLRYFALTGAVLGLLCLTRPSFVVLIPVLLLLVVLSWRWVARDDMGTVWSRLVAVAVASLVVVGPWIVRNHISIGKWGLTEEYGSAALIERFAYNDMTVREFMVAFCYCVPGIGDIAFDRINGNGSMHRFVYHTPGSFFRVGRDRRDSLVKAHGRLDPLIGGIVRDEMRQNWWRHLLVSFPLGWCGMWAGWQWGLVLIPLFGVAGVRTIRQSQPLLLLYAAPAIVMLGLHAAVANHYTRYNLILIGPLSIGAAFVISAWLRTLRWPSRASAPAR